MIKIENFDLLNPSGISYGGHGGSKRGVIINEERCFLKYPINKKRRNFTIKILGGISKWKINLI